MEVSVRQKGKHRIIAVEGDIDFYNVGQLKARVEEAGGADAESLAIDLSRTSSIGSSGIAYLGNISKIFSKARKTFTLISPNERIHYTLKLAALTSLFRILDSEDDLD